MSSVGIRELKNHLSRYLAAVQRGEDVVVIEHGKPVARLTSIAEQQLHPVPDRRWHDELAAKGLIRPALRKRRPKGPPPMKLPGKPLSEIIIEDRG